MAWPIRTKLILAIIVIIGFLVLISSNFLSAIDAPHNESNNVYCGSCHGQTVLDSSPFWGGTMSYDQLCLKCHIAPSGPYFDIYAPLVETHSSANTNNIYGDWAKQCVDCHDPHYQLQKDFKNTDTSNLYLASGGTTGKITSCLYNGDGTSTLTYSAISYKSGWNATRLTAKTGHYRGAILFPNVNKLGYSYSVSAIDEGAKTITVKGDATAYLYPPTNFAIIYGQYIKDYIDDTVVQGIVNIDTGNGADGPITINTVKNINTDVITGGRSYPDGVNWQITNSVAFGQATISSGTSRPNGFVIGDEIMIINLKGTSTIYSNVGLYEFKTITAIPNSTSITVDSNLTNSYDGTTQKIMVQRVPNYTDVTINTGGSLTCSAFDGNKGGVVVFKASGTVTINAADGITASNKGYRGGNGGGEGATGETYNGNGGGGGGGVNGSWCGLTTPGSGTVGGGGGGGGCGTGSSGGSGGGGGYGSVGSGANPGNGITGGNGGYSQGGGGGSYGVSNLSSTLFLGSGGGGGGGALCYQNGVGFYSSSGGSGGIGGGIIYISATTVTLNSGTVSSKGSNGTSGSGSCYSGGHGGGGAGGSIAILAGQVSNSGSISASGGSGAGGGRTYAAYLSLNGNNPAPNYSSSIGRIITPGNSPFKVQVKFFDQTGTNSFADGNSTYTLSDGYVSFNGICALCHGQTNHFRGTPNSGAADQNHTNLSFLGNSIPGTNCISCHTHDGGFKATTSCLGCHSMSINNRANIGAQFNGNSHHVQGIEVTGVACYQCHWEADSDGTVNSLYHGGTSGSAVDLVVYGTGTRPTTYTPGTTAIQYTANGTRSEIKKLNTHCLSCHSAQNSATVPFEDGKTPQQYAWDGKSIDERYSQTGTTTWGKYSRGRTTPKNTQTKAYSAHGNAINNQGGWDLNETWPNTRNGTENVACFDCHNSHGSSVSGVTTSYASATANGGILKDTASGTGGYSMTYKPRAGGSTANHNAYNAGAGLCFDCHLNAASGTTPWGYNGTFGATQAIEGYWDTPYFGPGTSGAAQRFPYKTGPLSGGHFVASSALSSTPTKPINGLCTPCHDPHGVSPTLGADMQYSVPMLKGTWLTSLYKEDYAPTYNLPGTIRTDRAGEGIHFHIDQNTFGPDITSSVSGITQTDNQFGGLCLNCHSKGSLTNGTNHTWKSKDRIHESVKGWKTTGTSVEHNYPCSKCHTPHSTFLPRLMVTNCLDSRHKGLSPNNTNPVTSASGNGQANVCYGAAASPGLCVYGGCINNGGTSRGSGNKLGNWSADICYNEPDVSHTISHTLTCHQNHDSNQYWNVRTPWTGTNPFNSFPPSLFDEPDIIGTAPISITLGWSSVTSPDGDPVQYYAQIDDDPNFGSPDYTYGWISGTSWTVSILTNGTWYWRVQARDANHSTVVSDWSIPDSFSISQTPPAPVLIHELDLQSTPYTLQWGTGPIITSDPFQYYVQMNNAPNFNGSRNYESVYWLSITNWTITPDPSVQTWYWRVKAMDSNTHAVSPWSNADSFQAY